MENHEVKRVTGHRLTVGGVLLLKLEGLDGKTWFQSNDKIGEEVNPLVKKFMKLFRSDLIYFGEAAAFDDAWKHLVESEVDDEFSSTFLYSEYYFPSYSHSVWFSFAVDDDEGSSLGGQKAPAAMSESLYELESEDFPEGTQFCVCVCVCVCVLLTTNCLYVCLAKRLEKESCVPIAHRFQLIGYLWYLVYMKKKDQLEWRVSYESNMPRKQIVYYWWKVIQAVRDSHNTAYYYQWHDWPLGKDGLLVYPVVIY